MGFVFNATKTKATGHSFSTLRHARKTPLSFGQEVHQVCAVVLARIKLAVVDNAYSKFIFNDF